MESTDRLDDDRWKLKFLNLTPMKHYQLLNDTIVRIGHTEFHPWPDFIITGLRAEIPQRLVHLLTANETIPMLWRAKIPDQLMRSLGQFPNTELERLLHISQLEYPIFMDWLSFCPSLLVLTPGWDEADPLTGLDVVGNMRKGWKHVLNIANWPVNRSTLKIIRKLPPCSTKQLGIIRQALEVPRKHQILRHLKCINSTIIDLLSLPEEFLNSCLIDYVTTSKPSYNLSEICLDIEALRFELNIYPSWPFNSGHLTPAILRRHLDDLELRAANSFAEVKLQLPPPPLRGVHAKNFKIEPISTIRGIFREGAEMDNCSASYVQNVAKGTHYLYRLELPERATALFVRHSKSWYPLQIKTLKNGEPKIETIKAVHIFAGTLPVELENDDYPF